VRQCEFSPPSETLAVSATPHIKTAPYTISERRKRRYCPTCRPPKLQKETSNVYQNSQPLPAHPIPVARRHIGRIAGHHKRRDACDTRTFPQLRRYKTNKFHCQPSLPYGTHAKCVPYGRDGCTFVGWRRGDDGEQSGSDLRMEQANEFRKRQKQPRGEGLPIAQLGGDPYG
jgi:hypothetical protein